MTAKKDDSTWSTSKILEILWFIMSAGLAYPAYSMLVSLGFNQALAGVAVFIGACLLYEVPYRARVRAQSTIAMKRLERLHDRSI